MTTWDKRENAFEEKFQHDQELLFKAVAKRNKLMGLWVAEQLGLSPDAAQTYARKMVELGLEATDTKSIIAQASADLAAAGIETSEARLEKELDKFFAEAKKAVLEA